MTYKDPLRQSYAQHKGNAKHRGIGFKLSFEQWLAIWRKSKRLYLMGNRRGRYVMARYGDKGSYEIGNVRIISFTNNLREAKTGKSRPDVAARNKMRN